MVGASSPSASLGPPVTRVPSLDKRWQELQELLRQEWNELTQSVETSMQETFQRQELLMNQYGAGGSSDWGSEGLTDAPSLNESPLILQVHPTVPEDTAVLQSPSLCGIQARQLHLHWDDHPSERMSPAATPQHSERQPVSAASSELVNMLPSKSGVQPLKSMAQGWGVSEKAPTVTSNLSRARSLAMGWGDSERAMVEIATATGQNKPFPRSSCDELDRQTYERRRVTAMNIWEMRRVCGEPVWAVFGWALEWWLELDPPQVPKNRLGRFVFGHGFGLLTTTILGIDTIVILMSTDKEAMSGTRDWVSMYLNIGFVAFYLVEMLLKLVVRRQWYFCDDAMGWNIFDFGLVVLGVFDVMLADVSHRGFRPTRVLRMLRFVRYFTQLRRILTSLIVSIFSLVWSIIMLMFLFAMFATVFVQSSTTVLIDPNLDLTEEQRLLLTSRFGHVWRAMITLFKAATGGDDWSGFYESIQLTGDFHAGLFLFFVAFAQFALLNVIMGMFVVSAMKLATPDRETVALEQRKADMEQAKELRSLISNLDKDGTGSISEEEFLEEFADDQFKARLALLDLDIKKAKAFFEMICDGVPANDVPIELFVTRAMRLKGMATSLDLETLLFGTQAIFENQILFQGALEETLQRVIFFLDRVHRGTRGYTPACSNTPAHKNSRTPSKN